MGALNRYSIRAKHRGHETLSVEVTVEARSPQGAWSRFLASRPEYDTLININHMGKPISL
jgi:hypothetical protein